MPITITAGPDDYPPIYSVRATGDVTADELGDFVREHTPDSRLRLVLDATAVTEAEAIEAVGPLVVSLETEAQGGYAGPATATT